MKEVPLYDMQAMHDMLVNCALEGNCNTCSYKNTSASGIMCCFRMMADIAHNLEMDIALLKALMSS